MFFQHDLSHWEIKVACNKVTKKKRIVLTKFNWKFSLWGIRNIKIFKKSTDQMKRRRKWNKKLFTIQFAYFFYDASAFPFFHCLKLKENDSPGSHQFHVASRKIITMIKSAFFLISRLSDIFFLLFFCEYIWVKIFSTQNTHARIILKWKEWRNTNSLGKNAINSHLKCYHKFSMLEKLSYSHITSKRCWILSYFCILCLLIPHLSLRKNMFLLFFMSIKI